MAGVITVAKQGMKRPERTHVRPHNELPLVPEIQGKARPVVPGTSGPELKVYHAPKGKENPS